MFSIGPYSITEKTVLAPMAGVTDQPFRKLCRSLGAGLVVSEMVTSDKRLWKTNKSRWRLDHSGEAEPISVQIAGGDAQMLAEAAKTNAEFGAQVIDINMGCPAKKVCNKAAGSALMKDERLVHEILTAVTAAVSVPVTLKIRTGWDRQSKNAIAIARMAEDAGIALLSVHGRTRADAYRGDAEYDTIARVKEAVSIPVLANGDIDHPEKAAQVLRDTGADGVMIGRAAQGNPWIFREINHYLKTGECLAPPAFEEVQTTLLNHLSALYQFYGDYMGLRIARKHLGWYFTAQGVAKTEYRHIHQLDSSQAQLSAVQQLLDTIDTIKDTAA
ncbi:tRNA-dihydrouridine synthase B [Reinekea sp. MED297]|uniref:tRNA-dihydrouridine synthase B n=2 Tax=Reinekea TaxID=230494 RepID=A4BFT9_9GAMM|nr:tRNA dihydrouridine synthase DusB [Reinekea blandensis]EAR08957.1 tRNA-dihydrouridine synthase B [Reinekea sp. MED297] [Reinekea blandensis MED297]